MLAQYHRIIPPFRQESPVADLPIMESPVDSLPALSTDDTVH